MPSTLRRSPKKAQDTYAEAHDSAVEQYGEGERAHRTAFAAVKHSFEKVGDHWEPKAHKGPSDAQAAKRGAAARRGGKTTGGVDANASKHHLYDLAKRLDIKGRSTMTKRPARAQPGSVAHQPSRAPGSVALPALGDQALQEVPLQDEENGGDDAGG